MNISCDQCLSKFRIPDEKIPAGKTTSFLCPKCKTKLVVNQEHDKAWEQAGSTVFGGFDEEAYDAAGKPFEFVEEDGKTALVCETDPQTIKEIHSVLKIMEYHVTDAENTRDALRRMRYHDYDLIIVNELFDSDTPDTNIVMTYVARLGMAVRRNTFVALLSRKFQTMDHMTAFNKSVNMIINIKNIDNFGAILGRGITDNDLFYRVYYEILKKAGRI